MKKILYFPTRYFPAISGAEFYIQRIAEIMNSTYGYNVNIITSNAVDFRALRDSKGKVIENTNKNYYNVNDLKINRFSINYSLSLGEQLHRLYVIEEFNILIIGYDVSN